MTSYRMPAEWEPHAATWLAWPSNRDDWPGRWEPVPWIYLEMIRALREPVRVFVREPTVAAQASEVLARAGVSASKVEFVLIPTDRSWTRDYGPCFTLRGGVPTILDWRFNAWAKYDDWRYDDAAAGAVARARGLPIERPLHRDTPVVLEGGAIDTNGAGTMLTTEECLLSGEQERNPGFTARDYEAVFARWYGVRKVLWLPAGIAGDDTHGHVDDCARFVGPRTVVAAVEPNRDDANHAPLARNLERLRATTDADGRPLEILELPMPAPVVFEGERLPASYANFYIANGVVLAPVFGDPMDREALNVLARAFPDRAVVPIYARDLVLGLGTVHCLSQQEPAGA
ncbi:MAG: agmatine deiminase family protein [Myxococcales bacterium]|nr:agmatine deiminase family protein [Myxococcales bacterium]